MARRSIAGLACALLFCAVNAGTAFTATISITGPEQTVYDKSVQACDSSHYPDGPPRAFRDSNNQIQLTHPHPYNRRFVGPDFDHLLPECPLIRDSAMDPFPGNFNDINYINSVYTFDGTEVFALMHVEYHGEDHPGMCPGGVGQFCSHNTMIFGRSTDVGASYPSPTPPSQLVASPPYPYIPDSGRWGYFSVSNILEKDGYYYVMTFTRGFARQRAGACLLRTQDLADPTSWRAWDGAGFTVRLINPYLEPSASPNSHVCQPVSLRQIGRLQRSFTYNTYLDKFFVIGTEEKWDPASQQVVGGIYYSFSDDMIHWSDMELLLDPPNVCVNGGPSPKSYPSVIDHSSSRRNFDHVGQTAHLYYVARRTDNCLLGGDRDIARVPIEFGQ